MKVKNLRPGILVINDAGLVLNPGEVKEIDAETREIKEAVAAKRLAFVGGVRPKPAPVTDPTPPNNGEGGGVNDEGGNGENGGEPPSGEDGGADGESGGENLDGFEPLETKTLSATDAIAAVNVEENPERLRECLTTEKRVTVVEAINGRLAEIDSGE